jgi:hypothetical protein
MPEDQDPQNQDRKDRTIKALIDGKNEASRIGRMSFDELQAAAEAGDKEARVFLETMVKTVTDALVDGSNRLADAMFASTRPLATLLDAFGVGSIERQTQADQVEIIDREIRQDALFQLQVNQERRKYEERQRDQERLARLIAQEMIRQLADHNRAANFPDGPQTGRTPDFAYDWSYEQVKRGRRRREVWLDFVELFLDDPTLSADDLQEMKRSWDKAIDRRRDKDREG